MKANIDTILVPLDGSDIAEEALRHAEFIAQNTGAKVIILQVVPDPLWLNSEPPGASASVRAKETYATQRQIQQLHSEVVGQISRAMHQLADGLRRKQITALPVVEVGSPAESIIEYANDHQVDLIAMSTHGRTGLARWLYGSVAAKVLREAKCPVLLVRVSKS